MSEPPGAMFRAVVFALMLVSGTVSVCGLWKIYELVAAALGQSVG